MTCRHTRIFDVGGKVSDMFYGSADGHEIDGYVPGELGIGGGDYIDFMFCANCGQIIGPSFPLPIYNPE